MTSNAARSTTVTARAGLVARLKLTEPVRLYLYGLGTVALLGLTLAGVLTGEWSGYWVHVLAVVLGVVPATEAARASVYSTQGHVQGILHAQAATAAATRVKMDPASQIRAASL